MSTSYRIDGDIIYVALVGPWEDWPVEPVFRALLCDPAVGRGMGLLCDFSLSEGASTMTSMRRNLSLAGRLTQRLGPYRCALVAPRDANYGMANAARFFSAQVPGVRVRAFRTVAEGERWLRRPDEDEDEPST